MKTETIGYKSFTVKVVNNEGYWVWIVKGLDGPTLEHGEEDTKIEAIEAAKTAIDNFYEN